MPQARVLGAGLVRAYIYWGQVEPRPGEYDFRVLDSLLDQRRDTTIWLTVCSSSLWATREASDFLPPSPAKDLGRYREFVRRLVEHAAGRVAYWQCENEPSNIGLTWAGTAAEYVAQLTEFHAAVKQADPHASVVLGGCGYDVLSSPPGSEPREFFAHLTDAGRDAFDLFDVHLYGDPAAIPSYVDDTQKMMRDNGYVKPVVAGEFAGPVPFEYPEVEPILQQTTLAAFAEQAPGTQSIGELVQRLVLALASGVELAVYWNLAPEVPGEMEPYQMMHLLFGKLVLLEYECTALPAAGRRRTRSSWSPPSSPARGRPPGTATATCSPSSGTAGRRCSCCGTTATRSTARTSRRSRSVCRGGARGASAVDAFGTPHEAEVADGTLRLLLTDTPVLVTPR